MNRSSKKQITPIVSVIIPTYNSSGTLRLTLQTVLWQDFNEFEIWVIGDGCTDDSEAVVKSFADKRVHWVNLPINSGTPSMPRNEGLRRARGQYIAYLGHDDLWFPWHVSELIDCIQKTRSDFVCSLGAVVAPQGAIGAFSIPTIIRYPKGSFSPSNWLHQRRLTDLIGTWSTDMEVSNDFDFLRRVLDANIRVKVRQQLSVLKFPSTLWRMYSISTDLPQAKYVEAMRRDASELRLNLLLELAALMTRRGLSAHENIHPFYRFLRRLIVQATYLYGHNRWPMNKILYRFWRRRAGLK